jgi:PUB domain
MSSSSSASHQENAVRLLDIFNCSTAAVDVQISDESTRGLFGDLYSGQQVLEALIEAATTTTRTTDIIAVRPHDHQENIVGGSMPASSSVPDDTASKAVTVVRSFDNPWTTFLSMQGEAITPRQSMPLEIHNLSSNATLRVRWVNQQGGCHDSTHTWDIAPQSTFEQYCRPGHFFVLSIVVDVMDDDSSDDSGGEQVVGAYRPRRPLPSLTAHAILFQDYFFLETMLLDATRFDALTVAAADLDQAIVTTKRKKIMEQHQRENDERLSSVQQTIHLLQTIVKNVLWHHPQDEKYHCLKLCNAKMKRYIVESAESSSSSRGAMEMLTILGFVQKTVKNTAEKEEQEELCLVLTTPTPPASRDIGQHALHLLDILQRRAASWAQLFVAAELAPPTPWQAPPPLTAVMTIEEEQEAAAATGAAGQQYRAGGFITPEERWARAERVALSRRSGRGRRPAPGEAPSSRGKWGR